MCALYSDTSETVGEGSQVAKGVFSTDERQYFSSVRRG